MTNLTLCGQSSAGVRSVPVTHICGSEHRARDFDSAWRPLQTHTRERWISVVRAHELGVELPPIDVIQIGNQYVVRDGHHRVSVARVLRHAEIDACITVWHVAGAPQEERPASGLPARRSWSSVGRSIARVVQLGRPWSSPARLR